MFFTSKNSTQKSPQRPPVPRIPHMGKENSLTKRIRQLDNPSMLQPPLASVGVYITSNESGLSISAEQLAKTPAIPFGCHIGFSGWHNFDIMALRRSTMGVISDINPENALFMHSTLEILKRSKDRNEFLKLITEYVITHERDALMTCAKGTPLSESIEFCSNVNDEYRDIDLNCPADEIKHHLAVNTGWLFNEERFNHIRYLALTDKIALFTENILATKTFAKLRHILQDNGVQIDTLYVSNISEYIRDDNRKDFNSTIDLLSESGTMIIDARKYYYRDGYNALLQRVYSSTPEKHNEWANHWWWERETANEYVSRVKSEKSVFKLFDHVPETLRTTSNPNPVMPACF